MLGFFEGLVAELYDLMASKTPDKVLFLTFRWLSLESRSHSTYLRNLPLLLGNVREDSCAEFTGIPWSFAENAL